MRREGVVEKKKKQEKDEEGDDDDDKVDRLIWDILNEQNMTDLLE